MANTLQQPADLSLIKQVARKYNPLDYAPKLAGLLRFLYPGDTFSQYSKLELHKQLNDAVLQCYEGETVLKYALFKAFQNRSVVAAYEIKVLNSRVDFLTINDYTTSFEIKSSLDNLKKLAKQSSDYQRVFDYNNLVVHERHVENSLKIVPEEFGIIVVQKHAYQIIRKPAFNASPDPETQLSLLTKKELSTYCRTTDIKEAIRNSSPEDVRTIFKRALNDRYRARWNFIVDRADDILPVDLQFFFNMNIDPACIYS